jgi:hypothetical protein
MLVRESGDPASESVFLSGNDTRASSSEAAAIIISGGFSSEFLGMSTKGVMPIAWGESLSRRDRGVERSGIMLASGMNRRVPRKSRKFANPKTGVCQMVVAREGEGVVVTWRASVKN